jgi:hypothetical protein
MAFKLRDGVPLFLDIPATGYMKIFWLRDLFLYLKIPAVLNDLCYQISGCAISEMVSIIHVE